jgi:cell division protein YceG involved in septum cleavage
MLKARFAFVTLCAIVVTGCEVPPPPNAVWVTIPSGDSIGAVAESLAAHDIVRSAERFERFARVNRRHLGVQAGTYPLRPRMPMGEVLATLRRGTHPVTPVTIRERATLAQVARRLERSLGVEAESILVAAHDTSLLKRVTRRLSLPDAVLLPHGSHRARVGATDGRHVRGTLDAALECTARGARDVAAPDRGAGLHHRG